MLAALFAPPVLLAVAMGLAAAGSKRVWALVIFGIAVFQSVFFALTVPPQELAGALAVSVLIPWALVATFIGLSSYPRHPVVVALVLPIIYVMTLGFGVIVGVNMGVVRV